MTPIKSAGGAQRIGPSAGLGLASHNNRNSALYQSYNITKRSGQQKSELEKYNRIMKLQKSFLKNQGELITQQRQRLATQQHDINTQGVPKGIFEIGESSQINSGMQSSPKLICSNQTGASLFTATVPQSKSSLSNVIKNLKPSKFPGNS